MYMYIVIIIVMVYFSYNVYAHVFPIHCSSLAKKLFTNEAWIYLEW